jgi:SAM-dependent methyltransferase
VVACEQFDELVRDALRFHRYLLARELARGRDVLEVGFGDGAGACLVARSARSVTGWDPSEERVAWARQQSRGSGVDFVAGELSGRATASADLILALEPTAWRDDPAGFHADACRILRPGGLLLVGGPSDGTIDPLVALLRRSHSHVSVLAQKSLLGSILMPEPAQAVAGPPLHFERAASGDVLAGSGLDHPAWALWLASEAEVPLPAASTYVESSDAEDRERQWRLRLAEREAELGVWLQKARRDRDAALRALDAEQAGTRRRGEEFEERLEQAARETRHVAAELAVARNRVAEMEYSSSWRLTGLLRSMVSRVRAEPSPAPVAEPVEAVAEVEVEAPPAPPPDAAPALAPPASEAPIPVDRALQRRALGLDLPLPAWKVSVLLAAEKATPHQLEACIASAQAALENGGLAGEILMTGSPSREAARSLRGENGLDLTQAHNLLLEEAFASGADMAVIADPGGLFHPGALRALVAVMAAHEGLALVEASLFPEESPKVFDRETLQTAWAANRCLAVGRKAFEALGGFDGNFGEAGQDIDLSWRARARGIPVLTAPHALFLLDIGPEAFALERLKARLAGGVLLARKWGAPDFEYAASSELGLLGGVAPPQLPDPVSAAWRAIPDFGHGIAFAQTRWSK